MKTPPFYDGIAVGAVFAVFFPILLALYGNVGFTLIKLSEEEHENKITLMLRRAGMSEAVVIIK